MNAERIEELRKKLGSVLHLAALDGRNDNVSDLVDLLAIIDDYERIQTDNVYLRKQNESLVVALDTALPLLEAAGRVNKDNSLHTLNLLAEEWYATSGAYGESPDATANENMKPHVEEIRAYLAALPDPPKEERDA